MANDNIQGWYEPLFQGTYLDYENWLCCEQQLVAISMGWTDH